jgi:hypothetical protein
MASMKNLRFLPVNIAIVLLFAGSSDVLSQAQNASPADITQAAAQHDGAHDFDFLIGNWKVHVRRLPNRLVGSNVWDTYEGISNHKKVLDSNANFEEFEVRGARKDLYIKGQTLRL